MRADELADRLNATLEGEGGVEISGLARIDEAGPDDLTFVATPRYRPLLKTTRAGAVLVSRNEAVDTRPGWAVLRVENPYLAFVGALKLFDTRPKAAAGIHPTAVVASSASIGEGASLGAYTVVGEDVRIGPNATLHPHVTIYAGSIIGEDFTAHAGAVVREGVSMGDRVTLQPGVVVGGDGFGFLPAGDQVPIGIPQTGGVSVGDDVDIGANATVDRAAVGTTRLGRGVKLDNLVMVAHGCEIGEGSMLAAQSGVAGSTSVGRRVLAGGQSGFGGHISVGDDVQVAGRSGVVSDVEAGAVVAGFPAVPIEVWRRYAVLLKRLPELFKRLGKLEKDGS